MADATNTTTPVEKKAKKDPEYIFIKLTPELRTAATKAAGDKPLGSWARDLIAKQLGVTLEPVATRKKYANKAEAKKATEDRALRTREQVARLLMGHMKMLADANPAMKGEYDRKVKSHEKALKALKDAGLTPLA